ncbi:MAG: hypothetical protein NZ873_03240 [Crenarchaeota archaeon]|nr:hypothetical protein [Thermoproteota archaeon]MDW8034753.1 hypothetical protein [Nitrososphaerota archaeon]
MYTINTIENDENIDKGGLQKIACSIPSITPRTTLVKYMMVSGLNPMPPISLEVEKS